MTSRTEPEPPPSPRTQIEEPGSSDNVSRRQSELRGSLGVTAIVFMVLAAAAPLTVIGGGFPIYLAVSESPALPMMYIVAGLVLFLFAVGLTAMARRVPRPGAFFTYVSHGLGRPLGLGAGHLALLTYAAVQGAVVCLIGAQLARTLETTVGAVLPWWIFSLAVIALCGLLAYRRIDLSAKVLGWALIGEVGIVAVLNVAIMFNGGNEGLSLEPFTPSAMQVGAPAIALMFAINGFIGFESTAIYRSEARDPERTVPRATFIAVILVAVLYAWSSWSLVMAWGTDQVVAEAVKDPVGLVMTTANAYLGSWASVVVNVLLLTSLFACILSLHNVCARYEHAMARAGVLPSPLARVHPHFGSPQVSAITHTIVAGLLIVVVAAFGVDPELQAVAWLGGVSTLGFLSLMALTCLAVPVYFRRVPSGDGAWRSLIAPSLALLGLIIVLGLVVSNFSMLVGGSLWIVASLVGLVLASVAVGVVQAMVIRRHKPHVYAALTEND